MENKNKENPIIVDPDELSAAKTAAESIDSTYTLVFRKPFGYDGKTFDKLEFNWDGLTGRDALSIENEMQRLGKALVVPAFSGEYLIRMAAKACTEAIGADAFELMPILEYNKVRNAARSFLLKTEL